MINENSRTKNTITNVITGLGTQLLVTILQFVSRTIFIQNLGLAYLGINGLFSNILTMLSLTELGLDTAINYQLYKPLAERNIPELQKWMKFYQRAYILVGSAMMIIGISIIPFLPSFIKDYNSIIALGINPVLIFLLFLSQSSASYLFFASKSAMLKVDQKMHIIHSVHFMVSLIVSIIQIITLILYKNYIIYTILAVVSTIVQNYITARIAKKEYPSVFAKTNNIIGKKEVHEIYKDLGALLVFKVNHVVITATDTIVLSAFMGSDTVGLYSNYIMFTSTITVFMNKIYSAIDASIGNLFATETIEKRYMFFQIMNYVSIILFGMSAVGFAVCSDELITVWIGTKYVISGKLALLVAIVLLFDGLKTNLNQIRNVSGVFRQMWYRPLIGVVINIIISIWLVHPLGVHGVVIGTLMSDVFSNLLFDPYIVYKYTFDGKRHVGEYYKKNVIYLSLLIVIYLLDNCLCGMINIQNGWISVIIHIIICAFSVPIVFSIVFFRSHENHYLLQMIKKVVFSKQMT